MTHDEFEQSLNDIGFDTSKQNLNKLKEAFSNSKKPENISKNLMKRNINFLAPEILNKEKRVGKKDVEDRLSNMDSSIKNTLNKINEYLKRERLDTLTFFRHCDEDGDGLMSKDEFSQGILRWKIPGMKERHLRDAFNAINPNEDEHLSLGELWLYIEGAKLTTKHREIMLEEDLEKDMESQIDDIFNEFKNSDKNVTQESIKRILAAYSIPSNVVSKVIGDIKTDTKGNVNKNNFTKFMMNFLKEHILQVEDSINELRSMFYEADINKSGFLDMDELYNFFKLSLNTDITKDELKNLVQGIDLDFNGELDIDEFINLMTKNPTDNGADGSAQSTYFRIRKSRKFDLTEFIKFLKKFPSHFQESFTALMYKDKKCLPSSSFLLNIISNDEQKIKINRKITSEPTFNRTETTVAAQLLLEGAYGIPHPEEDMIPIDEIKKRVVRATIFDFDKKEFIGNSSYVVASLNPKHTDEWKFNKWSETGTNPLLFRT